MRRCKQPHRNFEATDFRSVEHFGYVSIRIIMKHAPIDFDTTDILIFRSIPDEDSLERLTHCKIEIQLL